MSRIRSFAPIAAPSARTLILGSMPGQASLDASRYYAHPRNAFWPILCELLDLAADAPYATRLRALKQARIALWDVLHSCVRPGSLDASIRLESGVTNDFRSFFRLHGRIERVFFNGTIAERLFRQRVLPALPDFTATLARLPSTSPAHASMTRAQKRDAWRVILPAGKLGSE